MRTAFACETFVFFLEALGGVKWSPAELLERKLNSELLERKF